MLLATILGLTALFVLLVLPFKFRIAPPLPRPTRTRKSISRLVDRSMPASDHAIADKVAQAQRDAAKFSKPFTVLIHEQDPRRISVLSVPSDQLNRFDRIPYRSVFSTDKGYFFDPVPT